MLWHWPTNNAEDALKRGSMVSSGDRSGKIRTYTYAQGRVTDHTLALSLYDLPNIIDWRYSDNY